MADLRESSLLFSLAALNEREKERVQAEADDARQRAEAEQAARLEAQRERARALQEAAERERAESRAHRDAYRNELDRLEAARSAELERAEREAAIRRELELRLASRVQEQRTLELRGAAELDKQRWLATLSIVAFGIAGALLVLLYWGKWRPEAEQRRVAHELEVARAVHARSDAEAEAVRATRRARELTERVSWLESKLGESTRGSPELAQKLPHPGPGPACRRGPRLSRACRVVTMATRSILA